MSDTPKMDSVIYPDLDLADAHEIIDMGRAIERENTQLREALADMLSGWRYIRMTHGDLYGVGWDRAQEKAEKALGIYQHSSTGTNEEKK